MRQPSIVIRKGKREERYEIYVEDYVLSFLKEKTSISDAAEVLFYGCREKGGRQYTIYGAGQDRSVSIFDKYDLLEEIGYRLTQTDPVFLIKEADGTYEVKGYKVFYNKNEEMQDYLIHRTSLCDRNFPDRKNTSCHRMSERNVRQPMKSELFHIKEGNRINTVRHYAISFQLGLVFIVLVAIVITSANSYDKMEQLNESAKEVFFVMENQEAEEAAETENKKNDIVVERDMLQNNVLQDNILQENSLQGQADEHIKTEEHVGDVTEEEKDAQGRTEEPDKNADSRSEDVEIEAVIEMQPETGEMSNVGSQSDQTENWTGTTHDQENDDQEVAGDEEGVEALSRNVARYYEVERGDTLYMISQKIYGDTLHVKKICEINEIENPDDIRYGQKIILP